jgi:hypothetical protein
VHKSIAAKPHPWASNEKARASGWSDKARAPEARHNVAQPGRAGNGANHISEHRRCDTFSPRILVLAQPPHTPCCYNPPMTLMEITYELQSPLEPEQLRALGSFANTYGLRRFRVDEKNNRLSFEYDASRLRETEVAHVLREARIPVLRRVEPVATVSQT